MKTYSFENFSNISFIGNIVDLSQFLTSLKRDDITKQILLNNGNLNIGGTSLDDSKNSFKDINQYLVDNDCFLLILRGCNDNPEYFKGDTQLGERIILLEDYSIILTKETNILTVGGGITPQRSWLKKRQNLLDNNYNNKQHIYFSNEQSYVDNDVVPFIKENNIDIHVVFTNMPLSDNINYNCYKKWSECDCDLMEDVQFNCKIIDGLFKSLLTLNMPLKVIINNTNYFATNQNKNYIKVFALPHFEPSWYYSLNMILNGMDFKNKRRRKFNDIIQDRYVLPRIENNDFEGELRAIDDNVQHNGNIEINHDVDFINDLIGVEHNG